MLGSITLYTRDTRSAGKPPSSAWRRTCPSSLALAHETHPSRSVLAERFTELVGVPPMQYLTRWRMILAAGMLRGQAHANLACIAEGVG